jgi:hypothetical protein
MKPLAVALALVWLPYSSALAEFVVPEQFTAKDLHGRLPRILTGLTTEYGRSLLVESGVGVEIQRTRSKEFEIKFPAAMHYRSELLEDASAERSTFQFIPLEGADFQWKLTYTASRALEEYIRTHGAFTAIDSIKVASKPFKEIALSQTEIMCRVLTEEEAATVIRMFFSGFEPKTPIVLDTWATQEKADAQQDSAGQPATRPESKSEGSDKPQPEAEGRSR